MAPPRHQFARAIKRQARESAMRARNVKRAEIVSVEPLKVSLLLSDETLTEDELDLSASVQRHERDEGLKIGDTAICMREGGDWTIIDVVPS